jgi:hypothetical protein
MAPRKHPPEGAQTGTLTPAISRAATTHGAHALDETPHGSEEQIQTQDPTNHPPHHVPSSLSGFAFTEYGPDRNALVFKVCCDVNCPISVRLWQAAR